MGSITKAAVAVLLFSYCAYRLISATEVIIPSHLLHHKSSFVEDLLSPSVGNDLHELLLELGTRENNGYSTNTHDNLTILHDHIGEAELIRPDGTCEEKFLVANAKRTLCVLPGRVDVGRHYVLTGGIEGLRESYESLISRVQSFGRYNFDLDKYDVITKLFASEGFQKVAKDICPADKQILDPFQFNFILQLPSQTVSSHLDAPYYWGASRFQFPQWILVAMQFSGLFADRFIDQVQVVGYLHKFDDVERVRGGEFVLYPDGSKLDANHVIPSKSFTGTAVDGSKTVHAAKVYMKDFGIPTLDKDAPNKLFYLGEGKWSLEVEGRVLKEYVTDDIRMTIVYRSRCFRDEEEKQRFSKEMVIAKALKSNPNELTLSSLLSTFAADMVLKKVGGCDTVETALALPRLTFAQKILDTYVKYPTSENRWIQFNHCLIGKELPYLKGALKLIGCS